MDAFAFIRTVAKCGFRSTPNLMKYHPEKTEHGWEMADENGMFEAVGTSIVFDTKKACKAFIDSIREEKGFDELAATERSHDN